MKEFTLGTMYWLNPRFSAEEMRRDCRNMKENGYTLARIIVWWELVEKKEGVYDFSFVERFFAAAEENGLHVMCTVGFYPPYWLTCRLDSQGKNDPGRYPSLERPEVREPLARLIRELVTRFRSSPALESWNIWNEPTLNTTFSPPVLEKFAAWLKRKYPTDEALADGWLGEYPVLGLIAPDSRAELDAAWLEQALRLGSRGRSSVILYDFYAFAADLLCEEVQFLCGEIKKHDTCHPTHTNLHGVNGNPASPGRDFHKTAVLPDSISCSIHQSNDNPNLGTLRNRLNFYCCGIDRTWSWRKDDRAMVGELQVGSSNIHARQYTPTPATITFELWQAYASGMTGVIHWLWQAWRAGTFENGEFGLRAPADGGETPRSRAVKAFAELFRANEKELLSVAPRSTASIAILDSYANGIFQLLQWLDHQGVPDFGMEYFNAVLGCYRALNEANFAVDFISEEEVRQGKLSQYKLLYLPHVNVMEKPVADAVCEFVKQGGCAWADGRMGSHDEHMFVRKSIPCHQLNELFGVREAEYLTGEEKIEAVADGGIRVAGQKSRQIFEPLPGATVHAAYPDGSAAAVDHSFGRGASRIWGLDLSLRLWEHCDSAAEQEIASFARKCGISPELELPPGIIGRKLTSPNGHGVIILTSIADRVIEFELPVAGKSLYGYGKSSGKTTLLALPAEQMEVVIHTGLQL